jgi:hypothetical protein
MWCCDVACFIPQAEIPNSVSCHFYFPYFLCVATFTETSLW